MDKVMVLILLYASLNYRSTPAPCAEKKFQLMILILRRSAITRRAEKKIQIYIFAAKLSMNLLKKQFSDSEIIYFVE